MMAKAYRGPAVVQALFLALIKSAIHITGSTSVDSTNCGLKILRRKNSRKLQIAKLEFVTHQQLFT